MSASPSATSTRPSPTTATSSACSSSHEESNPDQGVREAMMAVGDSGSYVQLLAPLTPDSPIGKFLDRSGPGLQQVAYRVDDIDVGQCDAARTRRAAAVRHSPGAAPPVLGSTSSIPKTPVASCSSSCSRPSPRTRVHPLRPSATEADVQSMQQIVDAINSGEGTSDDFAALEVPEAYTGALLRQEDEKMFEGVATRDRDPRKSLRIEDVPVPEVGPGEALVAVMASSINYNTVWSSHLRAGVDLRLPASLRTHVTAGQAPRPALPRDSALTCPAWCCAPVPASTSGSPGDEVVAHCAVRRAREPTRSQRHDARPRAAHLGLRDQLRRPRSARARQGEPAAREACTPQLGGGRVARPRQQHGLPPARQPERCRHEAGRHRADLGRQRRTRLLRDPDGAQRRGDAGLRRLVAGEGRDRAQHGRRPHHRPQRRGLPVLEGRVDARPV